jgi:putative membrane protein
MSYLDDPRVLFAAQRTLLAWPLTAIALMGFGLVVERFGLFLRMVSNQPLSPSQRSLSMRLGVSLLVPGAGVSVISALRYRTVLRSLGEKEFPKGDWSGLGCGSTSCWPSWRFHWPPHSSPATWPSPDISPVAPKWNVRWPLAPPAGT